MSNTELDTQFYPATDSYLYEGRFFLFAKDRLVLTGDQCVAQALTYGEIIEHPIISTTQIRLSSALPIGQWQGQRYFALDCVELHPELKSTHLWNCLDGDTEFFNLAGRALQILNWQRTHLYCGRCGTPNREPADELCMACPSCGYRSYPRLAPCVIMAIYRGKELLLAQRPGSEHGFFTVLAGFVEPGESAEHAVRREVREEAGIHIKNIRYFDSQPWPFPGQLMLGFTAEYAGGELTPDPSELANADWFDVSQLPKHPGINTISDPLIRHMAENLSR